MNLIGFTPIIVIKDKHWRYLSILVFICCVVSPAFAGLAEIVTLTGKGEYRNQNESAWSEAKLKQSLETGNFVRTGDLSAMALLFVDKTQIRLSQNSMFQLKGVDSKSGDAIINLRQGRSWAQSKNRSNNLLMETPSAIAAIHGTDWEMEVDADGRARLTVLHGEVAFYNEQGSVTVGNNEQAIAEKGKAPTKMLLQNPAERVQWVTSYAVDISRYKELGEITGVGEEAIGLREIVGLIRVQDMKQAYDRLLELTCTAQLDSPVTFLLLADFAIYNGGLEHASSLLRQGQERFPDDDRLDAQLARVALYRDDANEARQYLHNGLTKHPDATELKLVQGEIARFDGDAILAPAAYLSATELDPEDARGWHGLGVVQSEHEDVRNARPNLLKALSLNESGPGTRAELATLETFADNLDAARTHYDLALQAHPDDYVALTGLGLLQIKTGQLESALRYLLAANTIEPRYARAVQTMAIAYYQLGQLKAALDYLSRAAELDERDPMPWFLMSLIQQDHWQTSAAIRSAREGMTRLPYLKSMNQLATDLQGAANLGSAYAQLGMEDWAMRAAQDSYDPFWAGSHFFLANRYAGEFSRNSELTLGFLTDPTAFGTSGRWQPLVASPGIHARAASWFEGGNQSLIMVPGLTMNGYHNSIFPVAWFVEGQFQHWQDDDFSANAIQVPLGVGMKPNPDWRLFLFANSFSPDINRGLLGGNQSISGENQRVDFGTNYRHSPEAQSWLKFGSSRETSHIEGPDPFIPTTHVDNDLWPERDDIQFRHSRRFGQKWEVSSGAEWAKRSDAGDYQRWTRPANNLTSFGEDRSADISTLSYASLKAAFSSFMLQADVTGTRLDSDTVNLLHVSGGSTFNRGNFHEQIERWQLNLGGTYRPITDWTIRLACQDWTRPVSFNTLAPVATAGIPFDDVMTLAGGRLQRTKVQLEWERFSTFTTAWFDHREISNIEFNPFGPDNATTELADLSRLEQRSLQSLNIDRPEAIPRFGSGTVEEWGLSHEHLMTDAFSLHLRYRLAHSVNDRWFKDNELPYVPEHQGVVGLTWQPAARWSMQGQAIYRSGRYADEANNIAVVRGWEGTFLTSWQPYHKEWQVDLYARSLFHPELPVFYGAALSYRF